MEEPSWPPFLSEQQTTLKLKRTHVWPAILTLLVLGGLIPECIATFNTAPRSFLSNPFSAFFLCAFYGTANLLTRELMRRRSPGLAGWIIAGIAFGFVNEGMIAGTWYTVVPTGYLLFAGMDWAWAVALTAFHTIYSIIIPISLVEALFPTVSMVPWSGRKSLVGVGMLFCLTSSLALLEPTYRLQRILVLFAVIALVIVAVCLPSRGLRRPWRPEPVPRQRYLLLGGCSGTLLFFGAILLVPFLLARTLFLISPVLPQLVIIISILLCCLFLAATVCRWNCRTSWRGKQVLAVITGALFPTILLSLLLPSLWIAGQPAVTLPFLGLLLWALVRTRKKQIRAETFPSSTPSTSEKA